MKRRIGFVVGVALLAGCALPEVTPALPRGPEIALPGAFVTVLADRLPVFGSESDQLAAVWLEAGTLVQVLAVSDVGRHGIQFDDAVEGSIVGWANLGTAEAPLVEPAHLAGCPPRPLLLMLTGLSDGERLRCYGDAELTFPAVVFGSIPSDAHKYRGSPSWLAEVSDIGIGEDPNGTILAVHLPPELALPQPGQWSIVSASFDDPRAAQCLREPIPPWTLPLSVEGSQLWCRQQLVVRQIHPTREPAPQTPPPDVEGPSRQP